MVTSKQNTSHDLVVLDTSVILYDANSIYGFDGHDIVIPLVVLDEIDKFRSLDTELGRNARSFIRSLNHLRGSGGLLSDGVTRKESGEKLFVKFLVRSEITEYKNILNADKNDDMILAVCLELAEICSSTKIVLVTKDISLAAKANVLGLGCEDYHADSVVREVSKLYTGSAELIVPGSFIDSLYSKKLVPFTELDPKYVSDFVVFPNTGVTLIDEVNQQHTALSLYRDGFFHRLKYDDREIKNVAPQNREQTLAFELMLDDKIKLVTLTGCAGTGKTLCALACGLHMVMDKDMYDRIVVSRPIQPMGKDIGFLPGSIEEKLAPWAGPIRDAVEFIFGGDRNKITDIMHYGLLEIEALTYIRGRSLPRTLFILDESQNLNKHEMKTIISRIGKGSKIILTGDIFQIDHPYLDSQTNGLAFIIEKMKGQRVYAHINLEKGERSELAELAAKIL